MKINGFQKLTLLDFPEKTACTIFTAGCNFRCPFCHNASLVTHIDDECIFSEQEILSFLEKRKGLLDGVCITGGEPLMQKDIAEFIAKIKALGYAVKLDTNGSFPAKLKELVEKGLLDYVAMDIKGSMENYANCIGFSEFDTIDVQKTIDFLLTDVVDYEFRTTVVSELHDEADIEKLALRIKGAKRYFLQQFVDSGDLIGQNMTAVEEQTIKKMLDVALKYILSAKIRGI